jgi:hypothetical protein
MISATSPPTSPAARPYLKARTCQYACPRLARNHLMGQPFAGLYNDVRTKSSTPQVNSSGCSMCPK